MKAPKKKPRHRRLELGARPFHANRRVALLVAASMVAFTPSQVLAKAPDTQGDVQASANIEKRRRVFQRIISSLPAIVSPLSCTISLNFPASSSSTAEGAFCFHWPAPLASVGLLSPTLKS